MKRRSLVKIALCSVEHHVYGAQDLLRRLRGAINMPHALFIYEYVHALVGLAQRLHLQHVQDVLPRLQRHVVFVSRPAAQNSDIDK